MTYLNLFHVERPVYDEAIAVGDVVTVGADPFRQYEVMAIRGQKAWLRDATTGMDNIVVAVRCRLVSRPFARDAL
jgi:glucose dehydrogenase